MASRCANRSSTNYNEARGLIIVFNGEIYNFRELRVELKPRRHAFRSHSGIKVLPVAYDIGRIDCLSRVNGIFVFALGRTQANGFFM